MYLFFIGIFQNKYLAKAQIEKLYCMSNTNIFFKNKLS